MDKKFWIARDKNPTMARPVSLFPNKPINEEGVFVSKETFGEHIDMPVKKAKRILGVFLDLGEAKRFKLVEVKIRRKR